MATLKPNKPPVYNGDRDEFKVRTWIYQVRQYLSLSQVGNIVIYDGPTQVSFASSFLSGTAAAWWYTRDI